MERCHTIHTISSCVVKMSMISETSCTPSYQYNPWRAPGSAPVIDPCGQAGGKYKQTPVGGDSVFRTVTVDGKAYNMGDLGSKVLPKRPTGTVWHRG